MQKFYRWCTYNYSQKNIDSNIQRSNRPRIDLLTDVWTTHILTPVHCSISPHFSSVFFPVIIQLCLTSLFDLHAQISEIRSASFPHCLFLIAMDEPEEGDGNQLGHSESKGVNWLQTERWSDGSRESHKVRLGQEEQKKSGVRWGFWRSSLNPRLIDWLIGWLIGVAVSPCELLWTWKQLKAKTNNVFQNTLSHHWYCL